MKKDFKMLKHIQRTYAEAVPIFYAFGATLIIIGSALSMDTIGSALSIGIVRHSIPIIGKALTSTSAVAGLGIALLIIGIIIFNYGFHIWPQQYQNDLDKIAKPSLITVLIAQIGRPFYNMFTRL